MNVNDTSAQKYICRELEATAPYLPLRRFVDSSTVLSPKPLGVKSTNADVLKVWDEAFTPLENNASSQVYLSTFDQYRLCRQLQSLSDQLNPEIDSLLSPRKIRYIPFAEVESLLRSVLPKEPHYLLNVKKVKRLIREIPALATAGSEERQKKEAVLESLDRMKQVSFFEPYLLLGKEEMLDLVESIGKLCHQELGVEFREDTLNRLQQVQSSSLLKEQIQELGMLYQKKTSDTPVISKQGVEATRHQGIYRLLAVLGLSRHVIPGVLTSHRDPYLAMPQVELQPLSAKDPSHYDAKTEDAMAAIGVIHALLHIQDGGSMNVKFNNEKGAVCYDLAKSLIPRHTYIAYSYPDCSQLTCFLTLSTIFTQEKYRSLKLSDQLLGMLASDEFLKGIECLRLKDYLIPNDPLRKRPDLVVEAERALKERGKSLHLLAKEKKAQTVGDVFDALFPDEMAMIIAGEKAGVQQLRGTDIRKIRSSLKGTEELEATYQRLIQSKIEVVDYAKLNR